MPKYVPGQSGNPAGRPKGHRAFAPMWEAVAMEVDPETKKTKYQQLIEMAISKALKGDARFAEIVMDRMEGKPNQTVDLTPMPALQNVEALTDDELEQAASIQKKLGVEDDEDTITVIATDTSGTVQA